MRSKNTFFLLSFGLAGLSLILVALGGYVRGTGAGLSCPDWPLCYGKAVPPDFGNGVAQEVVHRYIASGVSLLTFVFAFLAFRSRKTSPQLWKAALAVVIVLFFQVILGGLTVLMKLNPFIVTSHLALGTIFFQSFAFVAADLLFSPRVGMGEVLGTSRRELSLLLLLTYLQVLLGGFVGSSGAALACPDLPFCMGQILPVGSTHQQEIHMLHRGLAIMVFLSIALVTVKDFRAHSEKSRLWLGLALGFVTVQIVLGVLNVYLRVPVHVAVTHLVVAQGILFSLLQAWRVKSSYPIFASISSRGSRSEVGVRFVESHGV